MFEIKRCNKCGAEEWVHHLKGKVKNENGKLFLNDGHHNIDFLSWLNSYGIYDNDVVIISVEREEINE
jgi:hypothetical protein